MNDRISGKWFFYYVRMVTTWEVRPRLAYGWPPVGGEVNEVLKKRVVSEEMALSYLELRFPFDSEGWDA